jgi:hypothetical protein
MSQTLQDSTDKEDVSGRQPFEHPKASVHKCKTNINSRLASLKCLNELSTFSTPTTQR